MKRCKYCDHCGRTDRGEEVCTKYLFYIGEGNAELPCKGFEFTIGAKQIAIVFSVALIGLILLISLL